MELKQVDKELKQTLKKLQVEEISLECDPNIEKVFAKHGFYPKKSSWKETNHTKKKEKYDKKWV